MLGPVFCLLFENSFVFLTIWEMKLTACQSSSIMLQSERMSDQARSALGPFWKKDLFMCYREEESE